MEDNNEHSSEKLERNANFIYANQQNGTNTNLIIDSLSGWIKFVGIYTIISGAITCLCIIGAAIGVPLIFAGISLTKASKEIKIYKTSESPFILNEVFTLFNKYFKIQGILVIVGLVLSIVYFAIALFLIGLGVSGFY